MKCNMLVLLDLKIETFADVIVTRRRICCLFLKLVDSLETLPVDDGWAGLIVLLLGDPHLLEGGKWSKDGASDPDGVLPLWWGNNLDLHGWRGKGGDLLLHTVSNAGVHGGASWEDCVGVQVLPDINIALHDWVVGCLVDTARLHTQEWGLEEGLWATEPLISDGDDLSVGKLVRLLQGGWGSSGGHFLFEVKGNIAQLLLDITDNFSLSGGGEWVASLCEDLHQVVCQVATGQVQTKDGMGKGVTWKWKRIISRDCFSQILRLIKFRRQRYNQLLRRSKGELWNNLNLVLNYSKSFITQKLRL